MVARLEWEVEPEVVAVTLVTTTTTTTTTSTTTIITITTVRHLRFRNLKRDLAMGIERLLQLSTSFQELHKRQ